MSPRRKVSHRDEQGQRVLCRCRITIITTIITLLLLLLLLLGVYRSVMKNYGTKR